MSAYLGSQKVSCLLGYIEKEVPMPQTAKLKDDVLFIDYDGTVLYAYSKEEFLTLSELPPNPDRTDEGLTSQGWNWNLTDAKAQVNISNKLIIGQLYVPADGKTHIFIHIPEDYPAEKRTVPIVYTQSGVRGVTIDWGDNTTPYSYQYAGLPNTTRHTYSAPGNYEITISVAEGQTVAFGSTYNNGPDAIMRDSLNEEKYVGSLLKKIHFGERVICRSRLFSTYGIEYVTFPSGIEFTHNLKNSFYECYCIKTLIFPNGVQNLEATISGCYSLTTVSLPSSIITLGDNFAYECYALRNIIIPLYTTSIGVQAFYNCFALSEMILPNGLTTIGNSAFHYCSSLENIELPDTITTMGISIFSGCTALRTVKLSNNITTIEDNTFSDCKSLNNITIPDGITTIGGRSFYNCTFLQNIVFPNTLTTIKGSAFYYLRQPSLVIPSSVTSIGDSAFYQAGYTEFHMQRTTPPTITTNSFGNSTVRIFYVPYSEDHSILEAYKSATNWSRYASYIQEEPQS